MESWKRPPAGSSVESIFATWLPEAFSASGARGTSNGPLIRAVLGGPGGGSWDVRAVDDELQVERDGQGEPDIMLRQPAADFLAALLGDPDLPTILPPEFGALEMLFLDARDVDLLAQVSGRLLIEMAGRRRRRWVFDIAWGDAGLQAGRPRTTVSLDGTTFERLSIGQLSPVQALMDGRLRVDGDRALAMQLAVLLAGRMARR